MRTSHQVIEALGLSSAVEVDELASRRRAYDCVHLGTHDLPIGTLLNLLHDEPALKPPRTGHLGNWEDIARGRAGAMDFNQAICAHDFGYPLIYSFTRTEADDSSGGDWVYLPGSLVERGKRHVLPLWTWDGTAYVRRTRDRAWFCPFVQTELDGELLPLVELHWRRMQAIPRFRFGLEAAVIVEHEADVRPMLALLLEEASQQDNPRRGLQELISHSVGTDGSIARAEIRRAGKGYWLDSYFYPSTEALVEQALVPFRATSEPREFFERIGDLPPLLPVVSNLLVGILSAIFATHYPDAGDTRACLTRPFNPHLHWGARDMAGYPPHRRGYFVERSTTRSLRRICAPLVTHFPDVDPVCIVLLPATVFMLCPTSAHPRDADLLGELFREVSQADPDHAGDASNDLQRSVQTITQAWLARRASALSPYFLNRFGVRRGVLPVGESTAGGQPLEPLGWRTLTFRQACMIVGTLHEALQAEVPACN
jgi:hypothetical protein